MTQQWTQAECTAAVEAAKAVCCLARTGSICSDLDGKLIDDYKNCKDNTSKDPFSRSEICTNFGIQFELTLTGQSRTTTSRRKTLYLELRMRGEMKLTIKPSC